MTDTSNYQARSHLKEFNAAFAFKTKSAAAINPFRFLEMSSGLVQQSVYNSQAIVGVSMDANASGDIVEYLTNGNCILMCEAPVTAGQIVKSGTAGKAQPLLTGSLASTTVDTSSVGLAFTLAGQPQNDGVEIVSSSAGDTTQTATVYGTTTATNTVVVETVTLNGTTFVPTVKTDWGFILAVSLSATCAGTVTFREASGDVSFTTLTTGVNSKGLDAVTTSPSYFYNVAPTAVASGATTKVFGLIGTNNAGTTIYDSKALNGATAITMNSAFNTVTYMLTGDIEGTRTVDLKLGAEEDENYGVGRALESQATVGQTFYAKIGGR